MTEWKRKWELLACIQHPGGNGISWQLLVDIDSLSASRLDTSGAGQGLALGQMRGLAMRR